MDPFTPSAEEVKNGRALLTRLLECLKAQQFSVIINEIYDPEEAAKVDRSELLQRLEHCADDYNPMIQHAIATEQFMKCMTTVMHRFTERFAQFPADDCISIRQLGDGSLRTEVLPASRSLKLSGSLAKVDSGVKKTLIVLRKTRDDADLESYDNFITDTYPIGEWHHDFYLHQADGETPEYLFYHEDPDEAESIKNYFRETGPDEGFALIKAETTSVNQAEWDDAKERLDIEDDES